MASGFGSVYFLLDASEQQQVAEASNIILLLSIQAKEIGLLRTYLDTWFFHSSLLQYKEAILAYAVLLKENSQVFLGLLNTPSALFFPC